MQIARTARFALGIAIGLASLGAAEAQVINTIAGGGPNHLPALAANLDWPLSVAVDDNGSVFIAILGQPRVFKVDQSGQLTVVAGNGTPGFSGDLGPATSAQLDSPFGIAVDAAGNLLIADSRNHRIRRVDAVTGIISTFAGHEIGGFAGDDGPATAASLADPHDVAFDAMGNLFIADTGNSRIRRVDKATGIITTVAGSSSYSGFAGDGGPATDAGLDHPQGIAFDSAGNLFIADTHSVRIRRVDSATGIITTVAGNGLLGSGSDGVLATRAILYSPQGIALDSAGNLFFTGISSNRIRRVDAATGIISTINLRYPAGFSGDGGPIANARFDSPSGIAIDAADNLWIADSANNRVRRVIDATGIVTTVAGNGTPGFSGDAGPATGAGLYFPSVVALDTAGNRFIADSGNNRVRRVDAATGIITTVAGNGALTFSGDGGLAIAAGLGDPHGIALDEAGNLFIADTYNSRIRRVDVLTGIITTVAGDGVFGFRGDAAAATSARLGNPSGIARDGAGNLFVADSGNHRIRRVDAASGIITTVAGNGCRTGGFGCFGGDGSPATDASLNFPYGVEVDAAGNLFIGDSRNDRVRRVDGATGIITTIAGFGCGPFWAACFSGDGGAAASARIRFPHGVTLDPAGNLFIADRDNSRIRRVDGSTEIITTVAGVGCASRSISGPSASCFSGDGASATSASMRNPSAIALDAAGNLLIADTGNHRIRQMGDESLAIQISIDIKPGSIPNSINPADQGVIPVAILGSEDFDVSEIDAGSLSFATGDAAPAHDLGDPAVFADHLEEVNGDGIADLVSHYPTEETGLAYGDMTACLSGTTLEGVEFNGCDSVRTVPDMDGDRLLDPEEESAGTNPFFRDSDSDGYDDGTEVLTLGTDPLDALDPAPAPAEEEGRKRPRNRRR